MTREELLSRIAIDPQVCFGKPCIRGRRIWVSLVLDLLSGGMKQEEIMKEYDLQEADVLRASPMEPRCLESTTSTFRLKTAMELKLDEYQPENLT